MAHYLSDVTQFLQEYKKANPDAEQQQQAGRALLWDKPPIALKERQSAEANRLKQPAYVYQPKGQ